MATTDEKQELVEDIKRPVRHYQITLWGYGAEYVAGESTKEEYDYWVTNAKERIKEFDLDEGDNPFEIYMLDKDNDSKWDAVPAEFARLNNYFEYDDVEHLHGAVDTAGRITVEEIDITTDTVIDTLVDNCELDEFFETYDCYHVVRESEDYTKDYIFTAVSSEKGTFFNGVLETQGRIDLSKISVHSTEIYDGDIIVHDIMYDEEYVEHDGADTNGKGMYINLVKT